MDRQLAQVNVADAVDRLDSPRLAGFVELLGPLDELARRSPGFVWRPDPATVDPADLMIFGDPMWMVVNLSVWTSAEALRDYVYGSAHRDAVQVRRQWFRRPAGPSTALWWVPAGERPSFAEAHHRLDLLRHRGPTDAAFDFPRMFDGPPYGGPGWTTSEPG